MIEIAILPAKQVIEGLPWTERYGGVARPLEIPAEGSTGNLIKKVYPVRKDLSADQCYRQNRYFDLVPNSDYANLIYFEQLGDFKQVKSDTARSVSMSGRVRLVYWLNYPKMGYESAGHELVNGQVQAQLVKSLENNFTMSAPFSARVVYSNFSVAPSSADIFSKYSYDQNVQALLFYPFDYGAIDFDIKFTYGKDCLNDLITAEVIECIAWN